MQRRVGLACLSVLLLAMAACSKSSSPSHRATAGATPGAATSAGTATAGGAAAGGTLTWPPVQVAAAARTSVVRIAVAGSAPSSGPFGRATPGPVGGTGTGMLLDTQGHILTNNHVVTIADAPAASIQVELPDGKTVPAQLSGRDPATDLAVVQIGASELAALKPIQWATPSAIVVGEPVVAIGYALDLGGEPTVTSGVVSALDREFGDPSAPISGAIQTDAAINPGNSGGPLFDWRGQVIGVNTAGLVGTRQAPAQGLNFAVSVQTAQPVAAALIAHGQVTRGYLGVAAQSLSARTGPSGNLPVQGGAGITQVTPGSPAEQAGLQPGDVITKVGSVVISNAGDLTTALTEYGPGMRVAVEYLRQNEPQTAQVMLSQRPGS